MKDPPAFSGIPGELAEWLFSIDEALASFSANDEVRYAASFLAGDARRWFMTVCRNGERPESWTDMKAQIASAFAPEYEEEQSQSRLLKAKQVGSLEEYISDFRRLCLLAPGTDELTCTLVFVEGLTTSIKHLVKREHPRGLSAAIKAARTAAELVAEDAAGKHSSGVWDSLEPKASMVGGGAGRFFGSRPPANRLPPRQFARYQRERRCFNCGTIGHIARNCRKGPSHPNADRQ